MKLLVALLIVINVATFLWVGGDRDSQNIFRALTKGDVNKQGMLLIQEVKGAGVKPVVDPLKVVQPVIDQEVKNKNVLATSDFCVRVGPFEKDSLWGQHLKWLKDVNLDYLTTNNNKRGLKSTRIFLGPFKEEKRAQAQIELLRKKKLDYSVRNLENGEIRIYLGYFMQKKLADAFLDHLQAIGIEANSKPEFKTLRSYSWLDITIKNKERIKTLKQRWPDKKIKITETGCKA